MSDTLSLLITFPIIIWQKTNLIYKAGRKYPSDVDGKIKQKFLSLTCDFGSNVFGKINLANGPAELEEKLPKSSEELENWFRDWKFVCTIIFKW